MSWAVVVGASSFCFAVAFFLSEISKKFSRPFYFFVVGRRKSGSVFLYSNAPLTGQERDSLKEGLSYLVNEGEYAEIIYDGEKGEVKRGRVVRPTGTELPLVGDAAEKASEVISKSLRRGEK